MCLSQWVQNHPFESGRCMEKPYLLESKMQRTLLKEDSIHYLSENLNVYEHHYSSMSISGRRKFQCFNLQGFIIVETRS
jgi:hypothetical protein